MSGEKPKGRWQVWGTGGLPSTTVPRSTAVPVPVRTRWLFPDTTGRTVDGDPVPVTCRWWYGRTRETDGAQPYSGSVILSRKGLFICVNSDCYGTLELKDHESTT